MHCFHAPVFNRFLGVAVLICGATPAVCQAQGVISGALALPPGIVHETPVSDNQPAVRAGITSGGWTAIFGNSTWNLTGLNNDIRATASNANALNAHFPRPVQVVSIPQSQQVVTNPLAINIPLSVLQNSPQQNTVPQNLIDQEVAKLATTAQARSQLRSGILQAIRSGGKVVVVGGYRIKGGIATYSRFSTATKQVPDGTETVIKRVITNMGSTPSIKYVKTTVPKFKTVPYRIPLPNLSEPYFAYRK